MTVARRVRARRLAGERGAVLVEAAYITPVFLLLVFGVLEFGFAFRDYLTIANTTRDGARQASAVGNDLDADYEILQAVKAASVAVPERNIQRIVVFHADGPDDSVPQGCKDGVPSSAAGEECNVYHWQDLFLPPEKFGCLAAETLDKYWCPSKVGTSPGRNVFLSAATGGPPDYIGVWLRLDHDWVTGLFGETITFEDTTIMRLEPRQG